jgi:hypothetical protein
MKQLDRENNNSGRIGHILDKVDDPERFGILSLDDGGNMVN